MKRIFTIMLLCSTTLPIVIEAKFSFTKKATPEAAQSSDQAKGVVAAVKKHQDTEQLFTDALKQEKLSVVIAVLQKAIEDGHPDQELLKNDLKVLKDMKTANLTKMKELLSKLSSKMQAVLTRMYSKLSWSEKINRSKQFVAS